MSMVFLHLLWVSMSLDELAEVMDGDELAEYAHGFGLYPPSCGPGMNPPISLVWLPDMGDTDDGIPMWSATLDQD